MIDNYIWVYMSQIRCRDSLMQVGCWRYCDIYFFCPKELQTRGLARSFLSGGILSYEIRWEPHCCFILKTVRHTGTAFMCLQYSARESWAECTVEAASRGLRCAFSSAFVLKVQEICRKKKKITSFFNKLEKSVRYSRSVLSKCDCTILQYTALYLFSI